MKVIKLRKCKFIGEDTPRLTTNHFYLYKKRKRKVRNKDEYSISYTVYYLNLPNVICMCTGDPNWFEDNFIDIQKDRKLKLKNINNGNIL